MKNSLFKKNIKKLLIVLIVLFVLWFFLIADNTVKTGIIAALGYIVGQIIVVGGSAALIIWFCKRRKN